MRSTTSRAAVLLALITPVCLVSQTAPQGMGIQAHDAAQVQSERIERHDPRFDQLIAPDARIEKLADGFTWVEGPVWDRRAGYLLFSDIPANSVYRWREVEGVELFLKPSGYSGAAPFSGREPGSNGLVIDAMGRLVLCEHGDRRITRLESDGRRTVLADRYHGRRLNSPNDATFDSRGNLYFTDPPFGLPGGFLDPERELDWSGVYRLSPDGDLTLLTRELNAPNGIALTPSERTLYVSNADKDRPVYLAFDILDDGSLGPGRIFFDATPFIGERPGGPDGLEVDRLGNVFAVGPGGVYVLAPDGTHLGTIVLDRPTSNLAWGGEGDDLYITAGSAIYRLQTGTAGT